MGVVKKLIVVEDRLEQIFAFLPKTVNSKNEEFTPVFMYGNQNELNIFLNTKRTTSKYPLIWLIYPFEEHHKRTRVELNDISIVIATETNGVMLNKERMETSYKKILFPLYDNIRDLFSRANIMNVDGDFTLFKHPKYSGDDEAIENMAVDIWDAIKITFSCSITNDCLRLKSKL